MTEDSYYIVPETLVGTYYTWGCTAPARQDGRGLKGHGDRHDLRPDPGPEDTG